MPRGKLASKACKHHQLSWKLSYDDIKDILNGNCLKASYLSMTDEIDFYLEVDVEDNNANKLSKLILNKDKSK